MIKGGNNKEKLKTSQTKSAKIFLSSSNYILNTYIHMFTLTVIYNTYTCSYTKHLYHIYRHIKLSYEKGSIVITYTYSYIHLCVDIEVNTDIWKVNSMHIDILTVEFLETYTYTKIYVYEYQCTQSMHISTISMLFATDLKFNFKSLH